MLQQMIFLFGIDQVKCTEIFGSRVCTKHWMNFAVVSEWNRAKKLIASSLAMIASTSSASASSFCVFIDIITNAFLFCALVHSEGKMKNRSLSQEQLLPLRQSGYG